MMQIQPVFIAIPPLIFAAVRTRDGYLNGAKESEHAEQNRKTHKAGKRLDEDYESAHYTQTALFSFHTAAASFEYFSS